MLLQIWVLRPVDDSSSDASDLAVQSSIAPPGSRTFLECCPPDLTLDQLCARLGARHDRIYPDKAPLVIKKLQDCYKLDLDLDYRVGDVFKDRDSATPQSSVVRVIQSLATRESSLPLESALRPQRKRLRSPSTTIAHNEWGVPIKREPGLVLESQYGGRKASKRQRLQEISRSPSPDISLQLFEKEAQEEPAGHATIRSLPSVATSGLASNRSLFPD
ncbi:MAG: hypothetical protein M1826_007381 [Phylliscum demangeonii]|nr:MAG: hypothetical protein M1826_007381 [Phylliscum demangeonii]